MTTLHVSAAVAGVYLLACIFAGRSARPPRNRELAWYHARRRAAHGLIVVPMFAGPVVAFALEGPHPGVALLPYAVGTVLCMFVGRLWQRGLREGYNAS